MSNSFELSKDKNTTADAVLDQDLDQDQDDSQDKTIQMKDVSFTTSNLSHQQLLSWRGRTGGSYGKMVFRGPAYPK